MLRTAGAVGIRRKTVETNARFGFCFVGFEIQQDLPADGAIIASTCANACALIMGSDSEWFEYAGLKSARNPNEGAAATKPANSIEEMR